MSQVLIEELPDGMPVVVLSGPSFAHEVARELPTAVVAGRRPMPRPARRVHEQFRGRRFRLYASDDVVGVELGGAYKNVIAIAAGVVEGLGLGHNALAGLVTRGLAEMTRLAVRAGRASRDAGRPERARRPGAHLYWRRQPQPRLGVELGQGRTLPDDPGRHADGGRRRQHADGRARARARRPASNCPSPNRWTTCWPAVPIRSPPPRR